MGGRAARGDQAAERARIHASMVGHGRAVQSAAKKRCLGARQGSLRYLCIILRYKCASQLACGAELSRRAPRPAVSEVDQGHGRVGQLTFSATAALWAICLPHDGRQRPEPSCGPNLPKTGI